MTDRHNTPASIAAYEGPHRLGGFVRALKPAAPTRASQIVVDVLVRKDFEVRFGVDADATGVP